MSHDFKGHLHIYTTNYGHHNVNNSPEQKMLIFHKVCLCVVANVPAVATAAGARAIAASAGPGPGAGARTRARPGIERQTSLSPSVFY